MQPTLVSSITREAQRRVVMGAAVTLEFQLIDADGEPTSSGSAPTIGITQADGTVVVAAGTATTSAGSGRYTYDLAARTQPELLVVTWTTGAVGFVDYVEVVGGVLWSFAEAVSRDRAFAQGTWSTEQVRRARRIAEDECYALTGRRWVPYYSRVTLPPARRWSAELLLPEDFARSVRDITEVASDGTSTAWTNDELADVIVMADGILRRRDGAWWPRSPELIVGFEHGADRPPEAIIDATIRRARYWLARPSSGILDRATSWTSDNGGTYRIIQPGERTTGDPEIDAIYQRYATPDWGVA